MIINIITNYLKENIYLLYKTIINIMMMIMLIMLISICTGIKIQIKIKGNKHILINCNNSIMSTKHNNHPIIHINIKIIIIIQITAISTNITNVLIILTNITIANITITNIILINIIITIMDIIIIYCTHSIK